MDALTSPIWDMANGQGKLYLGPDALENFSQTLQGRRHRVFLLMDDNTKRDCLPILAKHLQCDAELSIVPGEASKNLQNCAQIWEALTQAHIERSDILINLGGGMICDLGGFAASTYKRGIRFAHMPTTLLAMADAAIGGKTGIDFHGYKNQIGSFSQPIAVVVHAGFLATLPDRELRSGYAEVLKHLLIHDAAGWQTAVAMNALPQQWDTLISNAIRTKLFFTEADPFEKSIRKALNFGHSIGHAIESHFLETQPSDPILHGEAVAAGIWCEAWLSLQRGLLTEAAWEEIAGLISRIFPKLVFSAADIPQISTWCLQDKKNEAGQIRACLLNGIGHYAIDQVLTLAEVQGSLAQYIATYP